MCNNAIGDPEFIGNFTLDDWKYNIHLHVKKSKSGLNYLSGHFIYGANKHGEIVLFENKLKEKKTDCDFSGKGKIKGKEFKVVVWQRKFVEKKGAPLSGKITFIEQRIKKIESFIEKISSQYG